MCFCVSTMVVLMLECYGVGVEYISDSDGEGEEERDVRIGVFRFV